MCFIWTASNQTLLDFCSDESAYPMHFSQAALSLVSSNHVASMAISHSSTQTTTIKISHRNRATTRKSQSWLIWNKIKIKTTRLLYGSFGGCSVFEHSLFEIACDLDTWATWLIETARRIYASLNCASIASNNGFSPVRQSYHVHLQLRKLETFTYLSACSYPKYLQLHWLLY